MNNYQESKLLDVSRQFQIYGDLLHAEPCKIGHINETYIATYNQGGTRKLIRMCSVTPTPSWITLSGSPRINAGN